ncbi:MAG: DUF3105 domain-containing protein [Chloroflexi bacterium]|nr:DUF3105 domain-containing protein [Chloroflexota bacterium]
MPLSRHRRRRGRAASRGSRANDNLSLARPRRKKINKIYLIATITIAVLVIGSFGLTAIPFRGGGGQGSSQDYVEGIGVQQDFLGDTHVISGEMVEYASFPPTSGNHWPPGDQASCGFYEDGVRDERAVHNLEHGNIVVSYNFTSPELVDQLRQVMDGIGVSNIWGITRSYDKIPEGTLALAAWGVLDTMEGIDPNRIQIFFDIYAGNLGPETVPCLT